MILVSEHYGCNTSCMTLFSKNAVRIGLDAYIRTTIVLIGGKLIGFYFLYFLYAIYYFVMMHL
jgi:hypothetical protein